MNSIIKTLTDPDPEVRESAHEGLTVEMNDEGVYGYGQLATILRARYCESKIESVTKTDGLTFRVREILEGVFKDKKFTPKRARSDSMHRPSGDGATVHVDTGPEDVKTTSEVVPQGVG